MKEKCLKFRPAEPHDAALICGERNRKDRLFLKNPSIISIAETAKWLENLSSSSRRLIVSDSYLIDNNKDIGIIRIDSIDWINRNCEIGLDVFDDFKGKGYAAPIYEWLLNHLFNELGFHSVYLEVLETNDRAIHIYKKLGFRQDGRLRQRIYRDGKFIDYLLFSLLKSEFEEKQYEQTCISDGVGGFGTG